MNSQAVVSPAKISLTHGQYEILADWVSKVLAAIAGTGGGKTLLGYLWLHSRMEHFKGRTWGMAEPTYPMLSKIILTSPDVDRPNIIDYFRAVGHNPHYHAVDKILETDYGQIYLGSADQPDSLQGAAVAGYWLDEAGMMSRLALDTALQRVSMQGGQVLLTTTPYNRGWLKTDVFDKREDEDVHVERWRSTDNPAFPQAEYERAKRLLPPHLFNMRFNAAFEKPEGLIYAEYGEVGMGGPVRPFTVPDSWPRYAGMDFGWNNPTAILWAARSPNGGLYGYKEYYEREQYIDRIYEVLAAEPVRKVFADPSGKQQIEELRRRGIPIEGAKTDVGAGLATVIGKVRTRRWHAFNTLQNYHNEVEAYAWAEDKDQQPVDKPVKQDDHLMDCKRYVIVGTDARKEPSIRWA